MFPIKRTMGGADDQRKGNFPEFWENTSGPLPSSSEMWNDRHIHMCVTWKPPTKRYLIFWSLIKNTPINTGKKTNSSIYFANQKQRSEACDITAVILKCIWTQTAVCLESFVNSKIWRLDFSVLSSIREIICLVLGSKRPSIKWMYVHRYNMYSLLVHIYMISAYVICLCYEQNMW